MARTAYAFNGKPSIDDQLAALTAACDPFAHAGLEQIGVRPGWQILDVGAGSGTISSWLADRVGDDGTITATDLDPSRIPAHPRITAMHHDITADPLPHDHYDLIHSRLVLIHLPAREQVLQKLRAALKPGAWLVLHEFDCTFRRTVFGANADDAALFDRVITAINRVLATAGAQLDWGTAAQTALINAGFADVATCAQAETCAGGQAWARLAAINTVQLRDQLLDTGLTSEQLAQFRALMDAPQFVAFSYLMTRTVARRPA